MIVVLSPAKSLDFSPSEQETFTQPRLLDQGQKLVKLLKKKTVDDLKSLMKISDKLAQLNVQRYQTFETPFTPENAKQALFAFQGDVYVDLEAESLSDKEVEYAQEHVRILSGLYGVLRPLDLMQPYRLEMGTPLSNGHGKNLYDYWDDRITEVLNEDLEAANTNILLNLASKEYFRSIQTDKLKASVLNIHFKEYRGDKLKVISFNAKKARGKMCQLVVKHQISNPEQLKELEVNGYWFNPDLSDEHNFTFVREPDKAIG